MSPVGKRNEISKSTLRVEAFKRQTRAGKSGFLPDFLR